MIEMGRIKSTMIKRAANSEFNHNKKLLGSTMPSKSVRNKIAGYLARIIRVKDNPKVKVKKEVQIEEVLA